MTSSRGLLAVLLFAVALPVMGSAGAVSAASPFAASVFPPADAISSGAFASVAGVESPDAATVRQVQDLRVGAAAPLLRSSVKQSQRDAFFVHKAPDRLSVLVVGCDFADSLLWGRDRADFPEWPPPARGGNYLYDGQGKALVDGQGRPIWEFAAHDSVYFDIQMRKVRDYFRTVSHHRFELEWRVHGEAVNLPEGMAYYAEDRDDTFRLVEMAQQVVDAIADEVDFTGVDTVVLIHAGAGRETDIAGDSPQQILSNYLDPGDFEEAWKEGLLDEPGLRTPDGSLLRHVLILPETETQDAMPQLGLNGFFGMRGVYCFEFGLRLGMLSLADFTPSGRPDSQGIGDYGLMGYGLFTGLGIVPAAPCAMNRVLMGWDQAVTIETPGRVELPPVEEGVGDTLIVKVPITDREYFLLEYRLQDPDGTYTYSFADLNGNRVPDFFDADSDSLDPDTQLPTGVPTSSFDPITDQWESTEDSEWDYFMSEFPVTASDGPARGPGRGNGLYVWHIDERVIRDALDAGTSTVNADPHRKGVDLEEADGIQDLDSFQASRFLLGWDRDGFRGEGVLIGDQLYGTRFADDTLPNSRSADGTPTGFSISAIDSVQLGSEGCVIGPGCPLGGRFLYRRRLGFTLGFDDGTLLPDGVGLQARRTLDRDGPVGDVRLVDLDGDGAAEIVAAGAEGALLVWRGDLSPWRDAADTLTVGLLARAVGPEWEGSRLPRWLGAPVIGDLDGDGTMEFFLTAPEGIYAFDLDGHELHDGDGDPSTVGLFVPAPPVSGGEGELSHPALLAPHDGELDDAHEGDRVDLVMIFRARGGGPVGARRIEWDGNGEPLYHESIDTSDGSARTGVLSPTNSGLVLFVGGPLGGDFHGIRLDDVFTPAFHATPSGPLPLEAETPPLRRPLFPSPSVMVSYRARLDGGEAWAMVDTAGVVGIEAAGDLLTGRTLSAPWSGLAAGPVREDGEPVYAVAAGGSLFLLDRNFSERTGGPYRPHWEGEEIRGALPATPLLADIDGDGRVEVLWHDRAGRLHAVDLDSRALPGWPLQGPGEPAGSPAMGDCDGDGFLELVAASGFDRLVGIDGEEGEPELRRVGELCVYALSAPATAFAPWPQAGGNMWATGRQTADSRRAGRVEGEEVLAGDSLFIYPNPVDTPTVRLRAQVLREGLVRATIYDAQGQEVEHAGPLQAEGAGQIEFEMTVQGLSSGLYLAKVESEGTVLVKAFAVVR